MSDAMLEELDALARREQRNRSELLREAVRRHLSSAQVNENTVAYGKRKRRAVSKKSFGRTARARLIALGLGEQTCPGLDRMLGATHGPIDMRKVIRIGKKLTGLSADIANSRNDRT